MMLGRFFKSAQRPIALPAIPAGRRLYVVGDIHGRLDLLNQLLKQVDADSAGRGPMDTSLIFLGDLVDRGPESAGVIERLQALALERPDTHFLLGNHEEVFLAALDGDERALKLFCRIGGKETVLSYGVSEEDYERCDYATLAELLAKVVPQSHRAFLAGFEDMIIVGDYAFVHAGVRPDIALEDQRPSDLRWIRTTFLDHKQPLEKVIVHGHTISDEVEIRDHRIGIDTGAFASGRLTALGLEADRRWFLQT